MKAKKFLFIAVLFTSSAVLGQSSSDSLEWHSRIEDAFRISKESNKPIFAFFTGSDWCGWCHKLQRDVFAKQAFKNWATDKVVLLELDFPRSKQLPDQLKQQNQSLQQFFKVSGFPTIWIFNMSQDPANKRFVISPLGNLGYPGGAEVGREEVKFIRSADELLAR